MLLMFTVSFGLFFVGCDASPDGDAVQEEPEVESEEVEVQDQVPEGADDDPAGVADEEGRTGLEPPPTQKEAPIRLGLTPTAMNTHYEIVIAGTKQGIDDLGGPDVIELIVQAPSGQADIAEQVNIVEAWVEQGIDAIAIATANDAALEPIFKQAAENGIPVFMFNMPVVMSTNPYYISNVGYDQREAGETMGQWIVDNFKDEDKKIAILEGLPGVHNTERLEGFMSAISPFPNLDVVASQPADWVRDRGQSVTENILAAHPDIDILWGMYDEMALGGVTAIRDRGLSDSIMVLGYDNTPDAYDAIIRGDMMATVDTAAKEMGYNLAFAVYEYVVKGNMVPKVINSEVVVYDQDNIDT